MHSLLAFGILFAFLFDIFGVKNVNYWFPKIAIILLLLAMFWHIHDFYLK